MVPVTGSFSGFSPVVGHPAPAPSVPGTAVARIGEAGDARHLVGLGREGEVVVVDAVDRAPEHLLGVTEGRAEGVGDPGHVDPGRAPACGGRDRTPHRIAHGVEPDRVEAGTAARARAQDRALVAAPELRDVEDVRCRSVEIPGELLAELPPAVVVDDRHLVIADAVDPVLRGHRLGVLDQEAPHGRGRVVEDEPAGPARRLEVRSVGVFLRHAKIDIIDALRVERAPEVIVDDIEEHRDPVEVAELDDGLELVDAALEDLLGERRGCLGLAERVQVVDVPRQFLGADEMIHLRGVDVGAVISHAPRRLPFYDGEELNAGDV
ncbi:MAG: hypothetical protein JW751_28335 [Polyangiaceae bacterium]|nr:hypothetical protein [Polyangiaceae bacterium]